MIIDTSAVLAILRAESDADRYIEALARSSTSRMSVGTYLEAGIVVDANGDPVLSARLDELLGAAGVVLEAVTPRHAEIARQAYRDFGKGSGHPAALNFGDCFAYALARVNGDALLYKGDNFVHTDLESVLTAG